MKKPVTLALLAAFIAALAGWRPAYAGEIDLLLQKLVDKGILTAGEAQEIRTETREEMRKEIAQAKSDTLPEWLQKVKMKGDFRLRYQNKKQKGTSNEDNIARIRLRAGVEAKVNDQIKAAFGLATGSTSDPRSTNVTLGGDSGVPASFKNIIVDYAYGQWSPTTWLTATGGKFKNPIWQPSDLLWDGDLNPEGANVQFDYRLNPYVGLFTNAEIFMMNYDSNKGSDTVMWAIQPGIKYDFADRFNLKAAVAGYFFTNLKGKAKFTKRSTNSINSANEYIYNYNSVNPSLELKIKDPVAVFPLLAKYLPYACLFSDFVYNPEPDTGKGGWDIGVKFGQEKVADWGQWQAKVLFAKLGRDAFLDIFPDSDRYSGQTNMKSLEAELQYGLGKNTFLGIDYYWGENLTKGSNNYAPQQLLQVDWNLKW